MWWARRLRPYNPCPLSTRRPAKITAAQQVHVQMRDRLSGALLAIDNEAIPVRNAKLCRQLTCHEVQVAKQFLVFRRDIFMGPDDLARDDQHVYRRLGIGIAKRQAAVILMDNVRRDLAVDDLLK